MGATRFCRIFGLALVMACLAAAGASADSESVVCFGDSATAGASHLSFPDYLEFFIEPGDGEVSNEGESGETTADGLWRMLGYLITFKYVDSKVWTYMEGGNDLIDWVIDADPLLLYDPLDPDYPLRDELNQKLNEIKKNLRSGIQDIHFWTSAEVVLGTYYYLSSYTICDPSPIGFLTPAMAEKANHYVDELNDQIRDLAAEEGVPLADLNEIFGDFGGHNLFYHDCNHVNDLGNFFVALAWWLQIAPLL